MSFLKPSFSVLDVNNHELKQNKERHVLIKHEATFKLKFYNPYNTRMQIDLHLNGRVGDDKTYVGSWILTPYQTATLETNKQGGQLFTFVRQASSSFSEISNYIKNEDDWGLVSVRFRTEQEQEEEQPMTFGSLGGAGGASVSGGYVKSCSLSTGNTRSAKSYSLGGIALSGSSDQKFGTTHKIVDWGSVDTIYAVRLVEDKITSLYKNSIPSYDYPV